MNRLKRALAMMQDEKGMDERKEKIIDNFYEHHAFKNPWKSD